MVVVASPDKLAALKIKPSQSLHKQAAEITRLVKAAFPVLADVGK